MKSSDQAPVPPSSVRFFEAKGNVFMDHASEFYNEAALLVVPQTDKGATGFMHMHRGTGFVLRSISEKYLAGDIQDGGWYACAAGLMGENGVAAKWEDAVMRRLQVWADTLYQSIELETKAMLVMCGAGEGPSGSTKIFVKTYGDALAAHGALMMLMEDGPNEG